MPLVVCKAEVMCRCWDVLMYMVFIIKKVFCHVFEWHFDICLDSRSIWRGSCVRVGCRPLILGGLVYFFIFYDILNHNPAALVECGDGFTVTSKVQLAPLTICIVRGNVWIPLTFLAALRRSSPESPVSCLRVCSCSVKLAFPVRSTTSSKKIGLCTWGNM